MEPPRPTTGRPGPAPRSAPGGPLALVLALTAYTSADSPACPTTGPSPAGPSTNGDGTALRADCAAEHPTAAQDFLRATLRAFDDSGLAEVSAGETVVRPVL